MGFQHRHHRLHLRLKRCPNRGLRFSIGNEEDEEKVRNKNQKYTAITERPIHTGTSVFGPQLILVPCEQGVRQPKRTFKIKDKYVCAL